MIKPNNNEASSVFIMAILFIAIISIFAETVLMSMNSRAFATYQSASWYEALNAAEAGADYGVATLNGMAKSGTTAWLGWSQGTGSGTCGYFTTTTTGTGSLTMSGSFTHSGDGNQKMYFTVTVANDVRTTGSTSPSPAWFRIRSVGTAEVPGPARVSYEKSVFNLTSAGQLGRSRADSALRKLTFNYADDRTGHYCHMPQVSRIVEVVEQPYTAGGTTTGSSTGIFTHGLTLATSLSMSNNAYTDSFSSAGGGQYSSTAASSRGDVAVNASGANISIVGGATVKGNLSYNSGTITMNNGGAVTGTQSNNFSTTMASPSAPVWTGGSGANAAPQPSPANMNYSGVWGQYVLNSGGTSPSSPKNYEISQLVINNGSTLEIKNPNPGMPSYINLWITNGMDLESGPITVDAGVYMTIYLQGNGTIGNSCQLNNLNYTASNLIIYGLPAPGNATSTFTFNGGSSLYAVIDAPTFALTDNNNNDFMGAGIFYSANIQGHAGFHYDQSLGSFGTSTSGSTSTTGSCVGYEMATWIEDTRDRVGVSGTFPP